MFDTLAKRAAALGFGLAFTLVLPPADGAISVMDAGHALAAYRYDLADQVPIPGDEITTANAIFARAITSVDAVVARTITTINAER